MPGQYAELAVLWRELMAGLQTDRHDIDSAVPRTLNEIIDLNQDIYDRMQQVFPDLPLVPSIGNNDVYVSPLLLLVSIP